MRFINNRSITPGPGHYLLRPSIMRDNLPEYAMAGKEYKNKYHGYI